MVPDFLSQMASLSVNEFISEDETIEILKARQVDKIFVPEGERVNFLNRIHWEQTSHLKKINSCRW